MRIISDIPGLRAALQAYDAIAFVPTMGNLHAGHSALVNLAKQRAKTVVVSIFVNPLQFAAHEDFDRYPRTLEEDNKKLAQMAVDVVFTPSAEALFPAPQAIYVALPAIADELCGAFRPGHFRGVATMVLKLFNIVQPNIAVFGKKDYQQLHIVRRMVSEFNLPIDIVAGETIRADDGLALSSRNGFLSSTERTQASALYGVLREMSLAIKTGECNFSHLETSARATLTDLGWRMDYISVRNANDLTPATADNKGVVIMAAGWVGKTRLIDNIEVKL